MKFYVSPLYVGWTINKADINTTTGVITRTVYTTLALGAHFFNPRNSSGVRTSLPKSLKSDTVYYIGSAGLYLYKVYSDEALTTQITFTSEDVSDVTQFEIINFGSKGYTYDRPFHAGSSTLAEMMCCPPDRTRHGLSRFCHVYGEDGLIMPYPTPTLLFQSHPKGHIWGFWPSGGNGLYSASPYTYPYHARIDIDPTDPKKIIVVYTGNDHTGIYTYKSLSMLAENFTGTVTVFRPALYPTLTPAFYTLVFKAEPTGTGAYVDEARVPPYALVNLPSAKFKSPQGDISIGNIRERLIFDEPSNRYVGSVQTYYGIKGRLFLDVVFYPSPSSNIKYLGNRAPAGYANRSVGYISNVDTTRTYTNEDRPEVPGIPFIFSTNNSNVFFDSTYRWNGSFFSSGINNLYPEFTSTPGLNYLAVSFAEISKGTKNGYSAAFNGVPADQNFRQTNVIKIVSTSVAAYVVSEYSTFSTPPPMPTPTPTPTPTPKGTFLASVPSVPFITSADGGSGSPAIINFEPPLNNGGSTITRYEYQVDGGDWSNGGPQTPVSISPLSVGSHTVCLRAVSSVGAGPSVCVSVTHAAGITNAFTYVGQTGAGTYSGEGLKYYNPTRGTIVAGNTVETITFTTLIAGVLAYDYSTNDLNALGAYGDMTLDGVSMGSISGTQRNSSTLDVVAGQVIVLSFTGEPEKTSTFEFAMFIYLAP